MEYEKIILELLMRVKTLEEKVELLSAQGAEESQKQPGTAQIKAFILAMKQEARAKGATQLTLKANDVHKAMGLKSRMPAVCNAMKQCMEAGDQVLHQTGSGFSSTYEILYKL